MELKQPTGNTFENQAVNFAGGNMSIRYDSAVSVSKSYTFKNSQASVFGAAGGTTSSLDTSGSNLIVVGIWCLTSAGENLSDNQGNTYTKLTSQINFGIDTVFYYCINPTTSVNHTFTTTSHFVGVGILAVFSTGTPSFDQESGSQAGTGSVQPGSITPSVNNSLVVTAFGSFNGTTAPSMPTGYTLVANNLTMTAEAGGMGYKIQTIASAENPSWTSDGTSEAVILAVFKP